jgi:hypothetical protein
MPVLAGVSPLLERLSKLKIWVSISAVLPVVLLLWGVALASYFYGYYSKAHDTFPARNVREAIAALKALPSTLRGQPSYPDLATAQTRPVVIYRPQAMAPGLTLISGFGPNHTLRARIVDANGTVLHSWALDWRRLWSDSRHGPAEGVMGMVLSPNGDLTFNLEYLGLVQVDVCGGLKWRLDRQTNHSLMQDEDGNFWAPEFRNRKDRYPGMPNIKPVYTDQYVLEISPNGKVLRRISLFDVLKQNGYESLLYMSSQDEPLPLPTGDMLHLNSVAVFPKSWTPGVFHAGDILVSMRNINTVMVFAPDTGRIKMISIGRFVRQHDARFKDGSTISVFDNNAVDRFGADGSSRIVEVSAKDGRETVVFEGDAAHPFGTAWMGVHRTLPNGNLLLTETNGGRVFEVTRRGEMVWQYNNFVGPHALAIVQDGQRIPPSFMSEAKLAQLHKTCAST